MSRLTKIFFLAGFLLGMPGLSFGQYILNGSATRESCNCYVLTTETEFQMGSVWQATKIDLNQPFDFYFDVFLGCRDINGADGIVFILQPNSTSIGAYGEGLGFQGIVPSIGIPLDTYQNTDDPVFDHISIQINGDIKHENDLAGPVPASATSNNIEDCNWHVLRIVWNPATDSLSAYFDGVFRLGAKINLVRDVFNNDPMVYWGFSGATGGEYNVQKFCTSLSPEFDVALTNSGICLGTTLSFKNNSSTSIGVKSQSWDFGDGTTSMVSEPSHTFTELGNYTVSYQFTSVDGCESPLFSRNIAVGDFPVSTIQVFDTCENISPRIVATAKASVGMIDQFEWQINNQAVITEKTPDFSNLPAGNYMLSFTATSEYGCKAETVSSDFIIKPKPAVSFLAEDACKGEQLTFIAMQSDDMVITDWKWEFENGIIQTGENANHTFNSNGNFPVTLTATAANGCQNFFEQNIFINSIVADAGKDTIVLPQTIFQLNAGGGTKYSWTPSTGLSNPYISNPIGNVDQDTRYFVKVSTIEGCTDTASVQITVFKGSGIYVPNAFTPNNDGLNDLLKPYLIGIKSLSFFTIYDRWGKKVYSTQNMNEGWNGQFMGKMMESGIYIWVLKAEDVIGKKYNLKGSFTLIK